jgi:hypothetical protein
MRKIIEELTRVKKEQQEAIAQEKEAKERATKQEKEEKEQKEKDIIKKHILNALGSNDDFMKQLIIDAVKDDKKEFFLLTVPDRDENLFPQCAGIFSGTSSHDEGSCQYIDFIAKVLNDAINKQVFDITLGFIGKPDTDNSRMNIFVKFSL